MAQQVVHHCKDGELWSTEYGCYMPCRICVEKALSEEKD